MPGIYRGPHLGMPAMKSREFNAALKAATVRGKGKAGRRFDAAKAALLPEETRTAMVHYVIRHRGPVAEALLTPAIDRNWLAAMGYMHRFAVDGLAFVGTGEHAIIAAPPRPAAA